MSFYERLDQIIDLLRRRGRVSYRGLQREFGVDDALLDDLKVELIDVQQVARDDGGTALVWIGPLASPEPARRAEAERRHVTVMFCDLVASTELAGRLDPEDLRDVLRGYQDAADEVVRRFGGVIARYVGDGLLIYFGYPQAHEDAAPRAVKAALGIVAAVRELDARLAGTHAALRSIPLRVRVGLHTGVAVMGGMGDRAQRDEMAAVGDTPNIAARILALAEPDSVLLTDATHRLLRGAFTCEPRGARMLKGIPAPVTVYRVVGEGDGLDPPGPASLTPLLGREQELGLLVDRWTAAVEGRGQVVVLSGGAGIGKSRLVQALKAHVGEADHAELECRCSPHHEHTALHPFAELLQRLLDRGGRSADDERLARLERLVADAGLGASDTVPFLAPLAGLPLPEDRYAPSPSTPERDRRRTLQAVVALVLALAAQRPVLLVVEDLHWVDPSTLECLGLLVDLVPTAAILLLLVARPDFRAPWSGRADLPALTLHRLPRAQIVELITAVAGGKGLPAPVIEQVVTKTDGVPLFVEELTKMLLESGLLREAAERYELAGPLPPLAIPATLQDSLTARLDRLSSLKVVVQIGAAIGRSFSFAVLHAVAGLDEATARRELDKLVDAELLYRQGTPPDAIYTFKHALIQDAAYQTLLKGARQQYHERIARALAAAASPAVEGQPELLAHHYTEAGLVAEAIPCWQLAGELAARRSAYAEAVGHLEKALALLQRLPDDTDRARQELVIRLALGRPLVVTRGHAAREVEETYARARDLGRQLDDPARLCPALFGLFSVHLGRLDLKGARALGEEILTVLESTDDPSALVAARRALGTTLFYAGELEGAYEQAAAGAEVYRRHRERSNPLYGREVGVACHTYVAMTLQLLGYPARAARSLADGRRLADELSVPLARATALTHGAWVYQVRREPSLTLDLAEAALALSSEHGFAQYVAMARMFRAWALGARLAADTRIAEIAAALAERRADGAELVRPYGLALLAEAYRDAGRIEEALAAVAEASAIAESTGERWWLADQHRLTGELLLLRATPDPREAERCFALALDVAAAQDAKLLELRAATSLGRAWRACGRRADAHRLVGEVHSRMTEGFETFDLRDAKAFLDACS